MKFRKFYYSFYFVPILLIFFLFGCSKNENKSEIPVVMVNFSINPNSTEYIQLNSIPGWVYVTGGYHGIIIYRISVNDFMAFERACPYDWESSNARVEVDNSGIMAICPECKSKFILLDGSPSEGVSPYPLKQYSTTYDGNLLYVYN